MGLKVKLKAVSVIEYQHQFIVDIQYASSFNSKILYFGVGIGEISDFFPGNPLNIDNEYTFVGKDNLITNRLEALDYRFTRYKKSVTSERT